MNEQRWERIGASCGVLFAVLLVAGFFAAPTPPHIDDSVAKITSYFTDNRTRVLTGALLNGLAGMFFLAFVGHLRHVLTRAERGTEALAPVLTIAGTALAVLALASALPSMMLAIMAGQGSLEDAGLVRALYDANWLCLGFIGLVGALFLASAGYAMVKGELIRPWLGWLGLAVAVVFLASGVSAFYLGSYEAFWFGLSIAALLAFSIWTFAASLIMLLQPEVLHAPQRRSILEPSMP